MVMNKLESYVPPVVNNLPRERIESIVEELFPGRDNSNVEKRHTESSDDTGNVQSNNDSVNEINFIIDNGNFPPVDIYEIGRSMLNKNKKIETAPGPDGIFRKIWSTVFFDAWLISHECLAKGIFPDDWKIAKLVLLPETNKITPATKYRPICLVNEIG